MTRSDCADKALSDLKRAGLNPQSEVRVLTVSDTWYPTVEAMSIATDVVLGLHMSFPKFKRKWP